MTNGELQRRPIRGALWGLLLGIGATALLIMYSVIAVGTLTLWVVLLAFIVLGVLWGLFGPAKRTRDLPPSQVRSVPSATTLPGQASQETAGAGEEANAETTTEADESAPDKDAPAPEAGDAKDA